jgi:hypothetical protein
MSTDVGFGKIKRLVKKTVPGQVKAGSRPVKSRLGASLNAVIEIKRRIDKGR